MELRYEFVSGYYVPQYKRKDNGEWADFKVAHIKGDLRRLCESIGDLQHPRRWANGQWHFEPEKSKLIDYTDQSLFFKSPVFASAFLGACKVWFGTAPVVYDEK
jgi:hypothetical protein